MWCKQILERNPVDCLPSEKPLAPACLYARIYSAVLLTIPLTCKPDLGSWKKSGQANASSNGGSEGSGVGARDGHDGRGMLQTN